MIRGIQDIGSRQTLLGYLAAFASAAGYGAGTFLAMLVVRDHAPAMTATFLSLVFGLLVMSALSWRTAFADMRSTRGRAWMVVSLSGLSSAVGVASLYLALERAPVVVVSPLSGANPLAAILMTHVFLKRLERVSMRTVAGAILVVAGVALVTIGSV